MWEVVLCVCKHTHTHTHTHRKATQQCTVNNTYLREGVQTGTAALHFLLYTLTNFFFFTMITYFLTFSFEITVNSYAVVRNNRERSHHPVSPSDNILHNHYTGLQPGN